MNWKYRHTMLVLVWVGLSLLGQLTSGRPPDIAYLAGFLVGGLAIATVVVYILGSGWQWAVRRIRS